MTWLLNDQLCTISISWSSMYVTLGSYTMWKQNSFYIYVQFVGNIKQYITTKTTYILLKVNTEMKNW